jgi:hypothetical protein
MNTQEKEREKNKFLKRQKSRENIFLNFNKEKKKEKPGSCFVEHTRK